MSLLLRLLKPLAILTVFASLFSVVQLCRAVNMLRKRIQFGGFLVYTSRKDG
ncbi:hypothetical protein GGR92_004267 [Spirosoma lacussanchae]